MEKKMVEYALEYAARGLPVFPLHTPTPDGGCSCGKLPCPSCGKHPRVPNGVKEATTDGGKIRWWWEKWPNANIGLATGGPAGVVVVDIDCDRDRGKFGDESLAQFQDQHGDLPGTWLSLTGGGGLHYFFHCSDPRLKNGVGILPGIDFRTTGGYVVAPPSLHASGRRYEWEGEHDPQDTELAELPEGVRELLLTTEPKKRSGPSELPPAISEGGRNAVMFRLASSLRARGLTLDGIIAAVWAENLKRCAPPLDRQEIETICASAGRYERGEAIDCAQADAAASQGVQEALHGDFDGLVAESVIRAVLGISDPVAREKQLAGLRGRAKALGRTRDFNAILKAYRDTATQAGPSDRPSAEIVLPDCPLPGLRCYGWEVTEKGVTRMGPDGEKACAHPILITGRLTNIDSGTERLRLAFYRDGKWSSLIVDRATVASRQKIVELANRGIQVTSENAKALVAYLSDLEAQNSRRLPRSRCVGRVGWAGNEFVPYVEGIQYDGDPAYAAYFNAMASAGDYEAWKLRVFEARERSPIVRIALAASFASPLMWPLGAQVFFLHLWGGTEVGKSVCQMVAMSAWGNPDSGALLRTYNATYVGMERMAAFCHSIPLALDEQQTVFNNRYFNMDTLIYNLCEGQGKGRGTKSGAMENVPKWRLCVLSSGEAPLTSSKSGGGAKNRVFEIYCKDKLFPDAPGIADFVKENHGHAGREYIRFLSDAKLLKEAKERLDLYRKVIAGAKRGTDKQINAAALLAVGDYLSSVAVFGVEKDVADRSTVLFCLDLAGRLADAKEISVTERAYDWVCGWIASNPGRFLQTGISGDYIVGGSGGELWGKENDEGTGYFVNKMVLDPQLKEAGFSADGCIAGFLEKGYIVRGPERVPWRRRIGSGGKAWCYNIICSVGEEGGFEPRAKVDEEDPWREEPIGCPHN